MIQDPPFDREETIAILSGRNRSLLAERDALAAKCATAMRLLREVQQAMSNFDGSWGTLEEIDAFLAAEDKKIGNIHGFSSAPDGWPSDWPKEKAP
jgi:hypothetical protein